MSTPDANPARTLVEALVATANERGFVVTRNPDELAKTRTKSAHIQQSLRIDDDGMLRERPKLDAVEPPIGLLVSNHSNYAVQIGQFGQRLVTGDWEDDYYASLIACWHGYQQYAAIARTWLKSDFSDDLHLFLVGPPGSRDELEWQNFAQVIERNDLVCRKLIWLPTRNHHAWKDELDDLLVRTFLAQPWRDTQANAAVSLDALSDSMSDLNTWRELLEQPEFRGEPFNHDVLVRALLEAAG